MFLTTQLHFRRQLLVDPGKKLDLRKTSPVVRVGVLGLNFFFDPMMKDRGEF